MAESDLDKVEGQLRVLKNKGESNETTTSETAGGTITPGNTEAQRINRQDINEPTVNRAGTGGVEKVVSVKQPVVKSKPIIKKESPKIDSLVMSKAITAQIVKDVSQQASEAIYKELMRKVTALLRNEYAKMVREGKFIRNPRPASIRSMEIKAKAQREVNEGRDFIPLKKVVVPKKVIKKKLIRQKPAVLTIVRKRNTEWDWVPKGSW